MKRRCPALLLLPAVFKVHPGAADLETQHAVDVNLPMKPFARLQAYEFG